MKKVFVDTNIFLEVFARASQKSNRCLKVLETQNGLWTTPLVIAEIEWVLRAGYELSKETIVMCLRQILSNKRILINHRNDMLEAVSLYELGTIDFTDCINAVDCKRNRVARCLSYDHHFGHIPWMRRLEP
ncbi:MAG: putative ribonuclease VapC [Candidatus Gottesmanbacteria bacterium GW2011_GWA2_44_17]|uniref:Putative ribonuclease VapC n=2 Tax=Candidatus Gottesmaniibacteriota TaxID=1752720 RepID=A0A0G1IJP5_9BACT|nr:MAG: putative ribonuclease VapC [Microgenomates group bacterium GW2011_GWC1_43_11]KKT46472.1 MAG: putative ribonuclease VapC [Candidatus Gottesmanbacteria bacterium GW2011_GWA2_44_17]KKT59390.1 MAG: putative ribonuclease VapC [Candidatus Gottesmanbacteria bacterium GW2011_GWA1_44_24b]HCM81979.1 hypothetical protein [Patescibacteria group bacterium]